MNGSLQEQTAQLVGTGLAPYATKAETSRGRLYPEPGDEKQAEAAPQSRTPYQRDRDRIIHCGAFRKLASKTQVIVVSESDYYRTRLTHSLEVAQISRSIARRLGLDEDLTEAIALAHDLGHSCFGHAGEHVLSEELAEFGGFDHNDQTFRVLTQLEHTYPTFDGLNLTWEMLEGVAKHNGPLSPLKEGKVMPQTIGAFNDKWDLELHTYASLEAQVSAIADDIAYNTHDVDDGYRSGLIDYDTFRQMPLYGDVVVGVEKRFPHSDEERIVRETVREVIGFLVDDLVTNTQNNLKKLNPASVVDIRKAHKVTACLTPDTQKKLKELSSFLFTHMYRSEQVNEMMAKAAVVVRGLFRLYMEKPETLPNSWYKKVGGLPVDKAVQARVVTDYIAGMTDRFAVKEHVRLIGRRQKVNEYNL